MRKMLATLVALCTLAFPLAAQAYPFGGMIGQIIFCYNNAIYAAVGPPNGGPFIWTPSTRTYQFGPPSHVGQWLLGLAAPPYYCLVSIQPIIVWSGILMTMEGSSGPAAPGAPGGGFGNSSGSSVPIGSGTGGTGSGTAAGLTHVVISEVYPQADSTHGGDIAHQWIELFNGTSATIDVSRWTIKSTTTSQTIPANTQIPPNSYLVFAGNTDVRTLWTIPQTAQVLAFPAAFSGFLQNGDHVQLQNSAGTMIDAVSWGSDTSAFFPAAPAVQTGHAVIRRNLVTDTNTAQDWVDTAAPTPGR